VRRSCRAPSAEPVLVTLLSGRKACNVSITLFERSKGQTVGTLLLCFTLDSWKRAIIEKADLQGSLCGTGLRRSLTAEREAAKGKETDDLLQGLLVSFFQSGGYSAGLRQRRPWKVTLQSGTKGLR
jgi:hypothetical protein